MQFLNHKLRIIQGAVVLGLGSLVGCSAGGNNPGIEYAPNMYVSEAYEAYTQTGEMQYNPHGMTMRQPVMGTVAQGQMAYTMYPKGYDSAASWVNPLPATKANVEEGGRMYNIYCQHCHGKSGKNDGGVIKSGKYPPIPWDGYQSDQIKNLPDGQAFHTITYGKGNMGGHGSVLAPEERWKVLHYVRSLSLGDDFKYVEEGQHTKASDLVSAESKKFDEFDLVDIGPDIEMINNAMKNIKFGSLKYKNFDDAGEAHLDKVAAYMKEHPQLKAVVAGHVAAKHDIPGVGELSLVRARTVRDYLISKGISEDRLKVRGKGNDMPIASNDTKEGREQNRRVEIHFIK